MEKPFSRLSHRGAAMKAIITLAIAAMTIGACSYHSETVQRQTPSGRTIVTESTGVSTPTVVVRE
jgi:hypothetical protein